MFHACDQKDFLSAYSESARKSESGQQCTAVCIVHVVDAFSYSDAAGSMLLVLLMTMATASLSASFAVFLVRERANKSKHVQTVSGAPPSAFWASVYLWDLINYAVSAAGQPTVLHLLCVGN